MSLSKSQYMRGVMCPKSLWLFNHRRDLLPAPTGLPDSSLSQGQLVEKFARRCFAGGILIARNPANPDSALQATKKALAARMPVYEAAFAHDGFIAYADILVPARGGGWDLLEVKMSSDVRAEHIVDAAFQRYVIEGSGLKLRRVYLMHLDKEYVRHGNIVPDSLFSRDDITGDTASLQADIRSNAAAFKRLLRQKKMPEADIGKHCKSYDSCEFHSHCWKKVPKPSIFDISHITSEKAEALRERGILSAKKIPLDFNLSERQLLSVAVLKSGMPRTDRKKINGYLSGLEYPLHYLDFETIALPIPPFDGLKPFQQLVFQISLHVHSRPGGRLDHFEYLGDGKADPRAEAVKFLLTKIGAKGSVIVYNQSFETSRIRELAAMFPRNARKLLAINSRIWDLMLPFQKGDCLYPDFACSYSIKKVLPALVPGMTYEDMEIGNGGEAQDAYARLMGDDVSDKERAAIRHALKLYCGQDTLAMVRLLEKLKEIQSAA